MAILRTTLFWGKACRRNGSQGLFHRNPFSRKGLSRIFLERVAATLSRSSWVINMKIYFLIAIFACFILLYFFATHLRDADNFYTPKALFHFWSFMPDKIRAETNFKIVHFFVNETSFSTHKLKKSDLKLSHLAANRENRRCTHNTSWTKQCSRNHNLQTKKIFGLVLFWDNKNVRPSLREVLKKVRCIFHWTWRKLSCFGVEMIYKVETTLHNFILFGGTWSERWS